jgi:hypothetical protein
MTPTDGSHRPGEQIGSLIERALTRLDRIAGVRPGHRPAHLDQLALVLSAAASEASKADDDPNGVTRDADLWRLREPGYLRAICEHPVARPGGAVVLLPVVLTWIALGVAELLYLKQYTATTAANRPPFFADWLAQPWYRGPVTLSAVIVLTVVWIMIRHRRPAREQAVADRLDRVVHRLEADLLPPLTILRARLGPVSVADTNRRAAAELSQAASRFLTATEQLAGAMAVVDRLGVAADRMLTAVPELHAQTSQLAELDVRLSRSVGEIAGQIEPLTKAVGVITTAESAATGAAARSEAVLGEARARLAEASAVASQTAEHQSVLSQAQQPFADAAGTVASAAAKLDATVTVVRDTATQLRDVIKEVNWLALVSDGLRHPEPEHVEPAP